MSNRSNHGWQIADSCASKIHLRSTPSFYVRRGLLSTDSTPEYRERARPRLLLFSGHPPSRHFPLPRHQTRAAIFALMLPIVWVPALFLRSISCSDELKNIEQSLSYSD